MSRDVLDLLFSGDLFKQKLRCFGFRSENYKSVRHICLSFLSVQISPLSSEIHLYAKESVLSPLIFQGFFLAVNNISLCSKVLAFYSTMKVINGMTVIVLFQKKRR